MAHRIHISLDVSNIERATTFYSKLFGQKPAKLKKDYANFKLDTPPLHLALNKSCCEKNAIGSLNHLGIELPNLDALEKWKALIREKTLNSLEESNVTCCYAKADKIWTEDPDGHKWEFWVKQSDSHQKNSITIDKHERAKSLTDWYLKYRGF
jgi:catechol-2,3-dioxygenase